MLVLITNLSGKPVLERPLRSATLVRSASACDCASRFCRLDYPDIYQAMTSVVTMAPNIGTLIVVILKAVRR